MPYSATPCACPLSDVALIKQLIEICSNGGKIQMTREEFKIWLASMDRDGDGQISKSELRAALKALGLHFAKWKAWRAMFRADLNQNKKVDGEQEIDELIKYAATHWGISVV